jgi:hypothetical protein
VLIVAGVIVSRIGGLHTTCFRRFDAYNCYVPKKWHYHVNRYGLTNVAAAKVGNWQAASAGTESS